ncbi:MAG: trehalose-phosphatase, partial [Candidatus Omnitrophica bacterium]|nr:trehalose-phosphatase [Candidatus Omnitrophota bacterium]
FDWWRQVKRKLNNKHVVFFFDYDGTLTPIAQNPQQAVIPQKVKKLLRKLLQKPDCTLAIISGRALEDIKHIVGLKGIIYAGNHGLEIEGPEIKFKSQVSPRLKSVIRSIYEDMVNKLLKIKGVFIEDKGLAISVHYRLVDAKDIRGFLSKFCEITGLFTVRDKIKISEGKKVYEIRPPVAWDKGKAVLWLLAKQQFLLGKEKIFPVYMGDDVTDEDGFRALKNKGLTIFVGEPKASGAAYYVKNTEEVIQFMQQVLELG